MQSPFSLFDSYYKQIKGNNDKTKSLNNRKRPVFDVTLWYWKFSLICLIISMIIWMFNIFESNYILAIIFAFGFLYSLLQGMVYKIIPFFLQL